MRLQRLGLQLHFLQGALFIYRRSASTSMEVDTREQHACQRLSWIDASAKYSSIPQEGPSFAHLASAALFGTRTLTVNGRSHVRVLSPLS